MSIPYPTVSRTWDLGTAADGRYWATEFAQTYANDNNLDGRVQALEANAPSDWTSFTMQITGASSNPSKATTPTEDKAYYRLTGLNKKTLQVRYRYAQTSNSGAAGGSGAYYFGLPGSYQIDSTKMPSDIPLGFAHVYDGNTSLQGLVRCLPGSRPTNVYLEVGASGVPFQLVGSSFIPLSGATALYELFYEVAIQ